MILLLWACAGADPCAAMCEAAAGPRLDCLAEAGLDWEAGGYRDAADFVDACHAWAWEMRLLAGEAGEREALDAACAEREAALAAPGADCATWNRWDWNALPWEAP